MVRKNGCGHTRKNRTKSTKMKELTIIGGIIIALIIGEIICAYIQN